MTAYIILSYLIMLIAAIVMIVKGSPLKSAFKLWLVSPFALPLVVIGLFCEW